MKYYGRKITEGDVETYQPLYEHLENTAEWCKNFVGAFSDGAIGDFMGRYHDIGKYSLPFQQRVRGEKVTVGHARAGALECEALYRKSDGQNFLYRLIGMAICGHHSGLMDYGSPEGGYCRKMAHAEEVEAYAAWKVEGPESGVLDFTQWGLRLPESAEEIDKEKQAKEEQELLGFLLQLYGRFLFSALVDADRIDAQNFPHGEASRWMKKCASIAMLKNRFDLHMDKLRNKAKATELNAVRSVILRDCLAAASGEQGFYSLTVPTGGGKTLSSMAFALTHALQNRQERVIYAIPFTTITEQNAAVFTEIFGQEHVLEHHSNFELPGREADDERPMSEKLLRFKLARENWYEPIVVTTNVQFFETLFSNRPGKVRKLHHIANSVIILDEAQSIPSIYIKPCMAALHELVANYHCTVVFCTATQPEFDRNSLFTSRVYIKEIMNDIPALFQKLRRTRESFLGRQTIAEIAERMASERQSLCIVNTKKHARDLFGALKGQEGVFHLSTNLYPKHRKEVLAVVRERLLQGLPCTVVSTQLIEAGIDIDFPVVFRAVAGIDSIVQAAGRCNREGKLGEGHVYVFEPEDAYKGKGYLARTAAIGALTMNRHEEFLDNAAVRDYFSQLFDFERDKTDVKNILEICAAIVEYPDDIHIPYERISKAFKLIENEGYAIVIPRDEKARTLLKQAEYAKHLGGILRQLSQYTVNVKPYELERLEESGAVSIVAESIAVLADENLYDADSGLILATTDNFDYII